MAMSTSLIRLPRRDWSPAAARHLLWRVGFGGSPAEVAALWDAGLDRAVEGLLGSEDNIAGTGPDVDPDVIRPLSTDERRAARAARQSGDEDALREGPRFTSEERHKAYDDNFRSGVHKYYETAQVA